VARALYGTEAALFGAGVLITLARVLRLRRGGAAEVSSRGADALLLVWLALPLLALGTRSTPLWWYYFDLLYPSQFILVGIALGALAGLGRGPARMALAAVALGLGTAVVLSQAALVLSFQHRAARQGALVLDASHFPVNGAPSPFGRLRALPLADRSRVIRTLRAEFGLGADGFPRRVHGAVLGLPEDSDYLLRHADPAARSPAHAVDTHYLIAREDDPTAGLEALRVARVGAYRIVEYRPMIDYGSWSYAARPGGGAGGAPGRWTRLGATWPQLEVELAEQDALLLRGALMVPPTTPAPVIAVRVTAWAPPDAIELDVAGVPARLLGMTVTQDPLMLRRGSRWLMGAGWNAEALFDAGASLRPGPHGLEVRLRGGGRTISVDVFERGRERGRG
jgi:hypothetical protein